MLQLSLIKKVLFGLHSSATQYFKCGVRSFKALEEGRVPCLAVSPIGRQKEFHTKSLAEAARRPKDVEVLDLNASRELLCHNLLCEKVGEPCICRVSVVLEKLTSIKSLILANNRLVSLPPSIWNLQTLEELDLSGNCLESVPEGVTRLPKLKRLNLDRNPLPARSLPEPSEDKHVLSTAQPQHPSKRS